MRRPFCVKKIVEVILETVITVYFEINYINSDYYSCFTLSHTLTHTKVYRKT